MASFFESTPLTVKPSIRAKDQHRLGKRKTFFGRSKQPGLGNAAHRLHTNQVRSEKRMHLTLLGRRWLVSLCRDSVGQQTIDSDNMSLDTLFPQEPHLKAIPRGHRGQAHARRHRGSPRTSLE